jgi:hypothetical protein
MNEENMTALFIWLKKDQEERGAHRVKMIEKNKREDELYLDLIMKTWLTSSFRDKQAYCNMLRWKKEGKNFTPAQRSVIANIAYKKAA